MDFKYILFLIALVFGVFYVLPKLTKEKTEYIRAFWSGKPYNPSWFGIVFAPVILIIALISLIKTYGR